MATQSAQSVGAKARSLRMSARKVRLIADLIRGMHVHVAATQLAINPKHASKPVLKLLNSAIANAEHNFRLKAEDLYVSMIKVDQGSVLKRWRPRAFGRAAPIHKHSCSISLEIAPRVVDTEKAKKETVAKDVSKESTEAPTPKQ